jgi:hypothetical protein
MGNFSVCHHVGFWVVTFEVLSDALYVDVDKLVLPFAPLSSFISSVGRPGVEGESRY